ncbi:MAG: TIGR00730 family Rossman fold protein, partial [Rhodobacteraceae bacterium]|nr:TIGR00730 family Rossman fold protein [Paracoccaceae bacterium]
LALLDHLIAQGFADASLKDFLTTCQDVPDLTSALRAALS